MKRMLACLALLPAFLPREASAQASNTPKAIEITLRPAPEPRPALKYRLVPERGKTVLGNAAVFYHRALQLVTLTRASFDQDRKPEPGGRSSSVDDRIGGWVTGPIEAIPLDEAKRVLDTFGNVLKEVELGAMRRDCDWGFEGRAQGDSMPIPEIQNSRVLARLVVLRARLAIREGKADEAFSWIQTGMAMGRHVADGPIIIQSLVGVAIEIEMTACLMHLIQVPGAPSFYWALANRPRPFIDMTDAMDGERAYLERELPALGTIDQGVWSLDQARKFAADFEQKMFPLVAGNPIPGTDGAIPLGTPQAARRLMLGVFAAKIEPEARQALLAEGRTETEVAAMPVLQLAMLHSYRKYAIRRDDLYKRLLLPYWKSWSSGQVRSLGPIETLADPHLAMFLSLLPPLEAARQADVRLDRRLDALQCIEAIRLYAHAHGGNLPATLDAIADYPTPDDLATGKPFAYRVEGDTATLSGPVLPGAPNHPSNAIHCDLKLAR